MGLRLFLFTSVFSLCFATAAKAEPIEYTPFLLSLISGSRTYVHLIPAVQTKGCTDEDVSLTQEFVSSREKLSKDGLIATHELINAYMLLVEAYSCRGKYDQAKYCTAQQDYLSKLKTIYAGAGKPEVNAVPLPGHYLHNVISLRTRCAK